MAGSRLLTARDYVAPYDNHLFWLTSCLCPAEDHPLDVLPEVDWDTQPGLIDRAHGRGGIAQIPVEYSFSGVVVVVSPHQTNFERPLRVETWDGPPPDDTREWSEAFEAHLDVDPHGLLYSSTPGMFRLDVPPGGYHAVITGRGFIARGNTGVAVPGDNWRIRLWPSPGPPAPRRLSPEPLDQYGYKLKEWPPS